MRIRIRSDSLSNSTHIFVLIFGEQDCEIQKFMDRIKDAMVDFIKDIITDISLLYSLMCMLWCTLCHIYARATDTEHAKVHCCAENKVKRAGVSRRANRSSIYHRRAVTFLTSIRQITGSYRRTRRATTSSRCY